jgi:hypothetical protein
LFTIGYKRLAEGGCKAFGWGRLFDRGFLTEGKVLEGGLLKGKNS